ncbi:hypothetical protein EGH56_23500 [Klebsiella aerogenes]|uniref:Uncharacterized protein n=1 Tax=Salmonella enterica TaxID=28901 RepID=A0A5U0R7U3_SALER|nr:MULTISPECIES: hypothetical protein [Enterobacteriaceae]EBQ6228332.1 hypothetical protein [Salmonella enterica subsp. enterica serovar Newport]EBO5051105.1 hypothetical protein [Salmonella enterica]ECK4066878.1 hypothetical protein [Salmonella enterica]ECN1058388.1 hypothetical protein [Salmonella enterica subsp. enterica serovar Newport]EJE0919860.1 hypothetical protein [Salmonella enterica]
MSKLKIERLIIRTSTSDGIYGADLKFGYGLNIISAENSSGKSTCIQSIIYALGLEGILGPSRSNPLKSALTTKLRDNNDTEIPVNESKIYLQLSNEYAKKITILRKSDSDISKIVTVYDCEFDKINPQKFTDYFLKDPGSAQREKGFHYFLSNFLGITQPQVIKYDGTKCPLYLESIFTVNYVEQTRGWGGILNVTPTYLGIKDLSQNVLEYTLNLDIREIRRKREISLDEKKNLETKWINTISELEANAKAYGFFVSTRIPDKITTKSEIYQDSDLYTLGENNLEVSLPLYKTHKEKELDYVRAQLRNDNTPNDGALDSVLDGLRVNLANQEHALSLLISDIESNKLYITSINKSLTDTKESLRKYRDIEKLKLLGSQEEFSFVSGSCPTCGQAVEDTLLPASFDGKTLTIEENIKYLEKTYAVFDSLAKSEKIKFERKEATLKVANAKVRDLRNQIKEVQRSISSPVNPELRELIRKEVKLEKDIDILNSLEEFENSKKDTLIAVISDWRGCNNQLTVLPYDGFSKVDRLKLSLLRDSFKSNLEDFGYKSTPIEDFDLSTNTYKPTVDGIDIGSEASASDNIRVIWSYLYSLLMLDTYAKNISTNHLGLLIMDEPRQQETKDASFRTFIKKASESYVQEKQIIMGTSEKLTDLIAMLDGLHVNLMHFDSNIIRKQ